MGDAFESAFRQHRERYGGHCLPLGNLEYQIAENDGVVRRTPFYDGILNPRRPGAHFPEGHEQTIRRAYPDGFQPDLGHHGRPFMATLCVPIDVHEEVNWER